MHIERNLSLSLTALVVLLLLPASAFAQEQVYRWEVGPLLGLAGENSKYYDYGGRATFNFNSWLAGEFQLTRLNFPHPGRQLTGIVHAKITHRFGTANKLSVFGIAGPGLLAFDSEFHPQNNINGPFSERMPAFNFGGGFEIAPFRRIAFRMDISDLLSRRQFEFRRETITTWNNWADYKAGLVFRF